MQSSDYRWHLTLLTSRNAICRSYYGLPEGFPLEQLLTRTRTGKKKNLYLSSKLVKELTIRNEHVLKVIIRGRGRGGRDPGLS